MQTGDYSNSYRGRVIPVTRGTVGASGRSIRQPLRVPGLDPHEDFPHVTQQLFGADQKPAPAVPWPGAIAGMAGFADDFDAWYESDAMLDQVMQAYSPAQLPVLNGLARAYAVSDAWFSSVPTQTNPNRAFSLCGTSLGRTVNNSLTATEQFDTRTVWNALPPETTWGLYYHDLWKDDQCCTQYTFPRLTEAAAQGEISPIGTFYERAASGTLPQFTYLEPKWGYGLGKPTGDGFFCGDVLGYIYGTQGNDYHPPTWMGPGEAFVHDVYTALTANAQAWSRTMLVILFDEHGGTYDHVPPPWGAIAPDDHVGANGFAFDRFGVRVPALVISPWVPAGTVFRSPTSAQTLDHTSLIATLLRWRGVDPVHAGLGARVAAAPTFEHVLSPQRRGDLPQVTLPDGYRDQGKECWIPSTPASATGWMRDLVGRTHSMDDLTAQLREIGPMDRH